MLIVKKQAQELVSTHKDYKIVKDYDYWGNWEYVLLKDNQFVARHYKFEVMRDKMYETTIS